MSSDIYHRRNSFIIAKAQPEVLVLDEAHKMLKNNNTSISKALSKITTKRKILLSGTPFQNNSTEYYRLMNFVRPGVLPCVRSIRDFETMYR